MEVGDTIETEHDGKRGVGIVTAIHDGRAFGRLTITSAEPWTSQIAGRRGVCGLSTVVPDLGPVNPE